MRMIWAFYDGFQARALHDGDITVPLRIEYRRPPGVAA